MKRYLWVVECRDGDDWGPIITGISFDEASTKKIAGVMQKTYAEPKYRAVKYTPEEQP